MDKNEYLILSRPSPRHRWRLHAVLLGDHGALSKAEEVWGNEAYLGTDTLEVAVVRRFEDFAGRPMPHTVTKLYMHGVCEYLMHTSSGTVVVDAPTEVVWLKM